MNGRELFERYSKQIDMLSNAISLLPRGLRMKRLDALRNRTGSLAMMRRYLLIKKLSKKCGNNVAVFPGVYLDQLLIDAQSCQVITYTRIQMYQSNTRGCHWHRQQSGIMYGLDVRALCLLE